MKTKRIKAPALATRLEFERAIDGIAAADAARRNLEAARDAEIQAVRSRYADSIGLQNDIIKGLWPMAEKYAAANREQLLPGTAKSAETPLAFFGFRTGMPALKLLSKCSWEKVLGLLDHHGLDEYVRNSPEVNKAEILKDAEAFQNLTGVMLSAIGVRVVQDEAFFIEPKEKAREVPA